MNLIQSCIDFKDIQDKIESVEELLKNLKKESDTLSAQIVKEAGISMTDNLSSGGYKFVFGYKNEYYPQYTNSDHSKKVELFRRLKEMNDDLEIEFFKTAAMDDDLGIVFEETANMHKTKFEKFMNSLPAEIVAKFVDDGLLFVDRKPSITIRKVKT